MISTTEMYITIGDFATKKYLFSFWCDISQTIHMKLGYPMLACLVEQLWIDASFHGNALHAC